MRYKTEKIHKYKETADSRMCDIVSLDDHVSAVDAVLYKSLRVSYKICIDVKLFVFFINISHFVQLAVACVQTHHTVLRDES